MIKKRIRCYYKNSKNKKRLYKKNLKTKDLIDAADYFIKVYNMNLDPNGYRPHYM